MALLEFPKTHLGKTVKKVLIAKCDGAIPSTAKFVLNPHPAFKFIDQAVFTLTPKTYHTFNVEFTPHEVGNFSWEI